jgi:Ca2+-binding EF-hand superfamily protein
MRKTLLFTALALASGLVLAQQAAPADRQAMRAEWRAQAEARFAEADKNADGKLDKAEAGDHAPRLAENFDRIDANADGGIDKVELAQMRAKMHQGRRGMHQRRTFHQGLFLGMDDDRNGAISRAELGDKVPKLAENFAVIDKDGNGELSHEEFRAHRQEKRAQRQATRAK